MSICPECDESTLQGARYHADCCPHDEVEDDDGRDGAGGRRIFWCVQCDSEVRLTDDGDGPYWEAA